MKNELVIKVNPNYTQIAFLENQRLVELIKEESDIKFTVGDIYLAKIKRIIPGLNAAFVNIGHKKDAFLHYLDLGTQFVTQQRFLKKLLSNKNHQHSNISYIRLKQELDKNGKISDVLKTGEYVIVQITKESISTKGPRLTSEISIAGRNMVLLPFSNKVSVSQKIQQAEERRRLKHLMQSIKPQNFGIIIRTASQGKKVAILDQELKYLSKKWKKIVASLTNRKAPQLLANEINRTTAMLRDILNASFESIYVDDEAVFRNIKEYITKIAPDRANILKLVNSKVNIFDKFDINKQIKQVFGKTVTLKNGGYLVIEHPEAFHAIDVNSGQNLKSNDQESNALTTNILACEEIARQLRLRDMGGIIVIDFIDMQNNNNQKAVYDKMCEEMKKDRAKHKILTISRFGLMQITRQRVRSEMNIDVQESCPICNGSGKISPPILIADRIENNIQYIKKNLNTKKLTLTIHPFIAAYLQKGLLSLRRKWQLKHGVKIKVVSSPTSGLLTYKFQNAEGKVIKR